MRNIEASLIEEVVSQLCIDANLKLRPDILKGLKNAYREETNKRAKYVLGAIVENAKIAALDKVAICQDTGLPVVFLEIGQDIHITGGSLLEAVSRGVETGYKSASLRPSIVADPIFRGKPGFIPAVIHTRIQPGNKLRLTVLPKGFGCENKTKLMMFNPTVSWNEIKKFIILAVQEAGPDACPPYVVGIGFGGTADYACLLAKKALLKKIVHPAYDGTSSPPRLRRDKQSTPPTTGQAVHSLVLKLEYELLEAINKLNIGPLGLGGKTTALGVNILRYPTHIAGLPVCLNISCHALRSATKKL